MYINKANYYALRIICLIGVNLVGGFDIFLICGFFMDVVEEDTTPAAVICFIIFFLILWFLLITIYYFLNKAKIYDSFFSNDADGIMYTKVIAKSLGVPEIRVISELKILISRALLKNCALDLKSENKKIILSNSSIVAASKINYHKVNCMNCGGENFIRDGFVYACQYCSGRVR